jgi:hypothetical protein
MYVLGDDEGLVLKALEVKIDQRAFIKRGEPLLLSSKVR